MHLLKRANDSEGFSLVFTRDFLQQELINSLPFFSTKPLLQLDEEKMNEIVLLVNGLQQDLLKEDKINNAYIRWKL